MQDLKQGLDDNLFLIFVGMKHYVDCFVLMVSKSQKGLRRLSLLISIQGRIQDFWKGGSYT